jgi:Tfp pilus assembly PilM family ATPase
MLARSLSPIGLDVGSRWIKAVQLRRARSGFELAAALRLRREGAGGAGGASLDAAESARVVGVLGRHGFIGRRVSLALPGRGLVRQVMDLPPRESGAPLDQIARAEMARAAKCTPEQMEATWWELPRGARGGETLQAMGVACAHSVADEVINAVESAGLSVIALDASIAATARACRGLLDGRQPTGVGQPVALAMIVDLGWRGATIGVFAGNNAGVLSYERVLEDAGLCRAFDELISNIGLEPEVALYVIERLGIAGAQPAPTQGEAGPRTDGPEKTELLAESQEIIRTHMRSVVEEVRASLAYATRRFGAGAPVGALFCGGAVSVPGAQDLIRQSIGEGMHIVAPVECVSITTPTELAEDPGLIGAIGLAMHDGSWCGQSAGGGAQ